MGISFKTNYISLSALVAIVAIAWIFLVSSGGVTTSLGESTWLGLLMRAMMTSEVGLSYFFVSFLMWAIMMLAMMLPAAIPLLLIFRKIYQANNLERDSSILALGFLTIWMLFSVVATLFQWCLHLGGFLEGPELAVKTNFAAAILLGAGVYQFLPIKNACLSRCRSPLSFLLDHWSGIERNAFTVGLRHGLFCLGCCWALMLLMFVGGVMSLLSMVAISVFILLERTLPGDRWVRFIPGTVLLMLGTKVLFLSGF